MPMTVSSEYVFRAVVSDDEDIVRLNLIALPDSDWKKSYRPSSLIASAVNRLKRVYATQGAAKAALTIVKKEYHVGGWVERAELKWEKLP